MGERIEVSKPVIQIYRASKDDDIDILDFLVGDVDIVGGPCVVPLVSGLVAGSAEQREVGVGNHGFASSVVTVTADGVLTVAVVAPGVGTIILFS